MKVLWVIGTLRNCVKNVLDMDTSFNVSGTWVDNTYELIKDDKDIKVDFLCCDKSVKRNRVLKGEKDGSKAFVVHLPRISFGKSSGEKYIKLLKKILDESHPDIIHIWGGETSLAYDVTKANVNKIPMLVFVQGVVSIHSLYWVGNYKLLGKQPLGLAAFYRRLISKEKQKYFKKQTELEKYIISNSAGILVDNDWTKKLYKSINPEILLFDFSLPINESFTSVKWDYEKCEKNRIFTVFGRDMNKGLFQLLIAIKNVKRFFPDVKIAMPGPYKIKNSFKINNFKLSLFEIWAKKYIKKNGLENNVIFTGKLDSKQMSDEILKCNIFVNPSCMEAQATSLREALFVGAPCISSVCGSVLDFMHHDVDSILYRYDEADVLASEIINLLKNPDKTIRIADKGRINIQSKFPQVNNAKKLKDIYMKVL